MLHFSTVTCVKDKHNSSFKVLSSLVYLRGKSASWLKIPAGSNSWLLILKWSEEVSTDHTDRTEEAPPEWRVQVMKLRGYDSFQRNMQIYTLMHRGEGDVNHLNAKYKDWYRLLNRVWTNMSNDNCLCITKPDSYLGWRLPVCFLLCLKAFPLTLKHNAIIHSKCRDEEWTWNMSKY